MLPPTCPLCRSVLCLRRGGGVCYTLNRRYEKSPERPERDKQLKRAGVRK